MARSVSPAGRPTRGTTGTNRLRRVDRWIASRPEFLARTDPLVVDLGYGASGVTAFELWTRLAKTRPGVEVLGLEIDPERVARAQAQLVELRAGRTPFPPEARVSFARGGFELPAPRPPQLVRAFNVLRQYEEAEVAPAWARIAAGLAPGGLLVEGTCDEIGRVSSWVDVSHESEPLRLTISLRLRGLEDPAIVAERLPKALIHRNVPGERIHELLRALSAAWQRTAAVGSFGAVQHWIATVAQLRGEGIPVLSPPARVRLGELTVPWDHVRPRD